MATRNSKKNPEYQDEQSQEEKIKTLQEMIAAAQQTIANANQMLGQLKGNSEISQMRHPAGPSFSAEGQVIHGTFDGQIMIGEDGKQYPVPANYASKSKLVEGDMLKLTITNDGNFVYKQIGPVERKYMIGMVSQDERGNYIVAAEGNRYKVLLAAATYFKIEAGDEVTLVVPRFQHCVWGAIENVIRKSSDIPSGYTPPVYSVGNFDENDGGQKPAAIERLEKEMEAERKKAVDNESIVDEWTPDIEALKKEAGYPVGVQEEDEKY